MHLVDEGSEAGIMIYECPVCGRQERQFGRVSSVQAEQIDPTEEIRADRSPVDLPPTPILPDVALSMNLEAISRWWDGGAGLRRGIRSIREWWNGGEGLVAFLEAFSEEDDTGMRPLIPVKPRLIRKSVILDRVRAELRVEDGPPIPLSDAQIVVLRRRQNLGATGWRGTAGQRSEDGSMWIFEVYVRYGASKCLVAEFRTRSGAEKCAKELREEMSCVDDQNS